MFASLVIVALAYTWQGFLPGRVFLPVDNVADLGAWKPDPTARVRTSNSLLSDVGRQLVPWDAEVRRRFAAGEIPWVDPYEGEGGAPLFANPQTALLSPFTWPRILFGLRGWALSAFLRLLVAGLAMMWFGEELGFSLLAAAVSGGIYMISGQLIVWLLYPVANVVALLPALAAALVRLLRRISPANILLTAFFAVLAAVGGHPETLFVGLLAIILFLSLIGLGPLAQHSAARRKSLLFAGVALAAGLLLAAIELVPFSLTLFRSDALAHRAVSAQSYARLPAMTGEVLPGALGSPLKGELDFSGAVRHGENFNSRNEGFVGFIVLLICVVCFTRFPATLQGGLLIGAAALLVSWDIPLIRNAIHSIPVVKLVAPEYWAFPFCFFVSLAAGKALVDLLPTVRSARGGGFLLIIMGGGGVLAAGLFPLLPSATSLLTHFAEKGIKHLSATGLLRLPSAIYAARLSGYLAAARHTGLHWLVLPGIAWVVAGAGLLRCSYRRLLVGAGICIELFTFGFGYNPAIGTKQIPPTPAIVRQVKALDPQHQFLILASDEIYPPNLATADGIRDFRSYDVLESKTTNATLARLGLAGPLDSFAGRLSLPVRNELAKNGVRFIFSRDPIGGCARVGGNPPPGPGIYEIPNAIAQPLPANRPPDGLIFGALLSAAGLALLIFLVRRRIGISQD